MTPTVKGLLYLRCAGYLLPAAISAPSPLTLTVATHADDCAIPEYYAGVSFETWVEGPNRAGVSETDCAIKCVFDAGNYRFRETPSN